MKNYFLLVIIVATSFTSFSQIKVGFVDSQRLLDTMPSRKIAAEKYLAYEKETYTEFQQMQAEFEKAVADYEKEAPNLTPVLKESRERKLMDKQRSLQERQQSLETELQAYSNELNAPILEKLQAAVKVVSERKKLSYVTDKSTTLYFDPLLDITLEVAVEVLKLDKGQ